MEAGIKGRQQPDGLLSSIEAARALRVTIRTIGNLTKQGLLEPVFIERKQFFRQEDIQNYLTVFKGRTDWASVASIALRCNARVQILERKVDSLLQVLGLSSTTLSVEEEEIARLYELAMMGLKNEAPLDANTVLYFAQQMLSMNEEYLHLVQTVTGNQEPWRVFLELSQHLSEEAPRTKFKTDQELAEAYGFMEAARRHMRPLAYFYVRRKNGVRKANAAFPEEDFSTPVVSLLRHG